MINDIKIAVRGLTRMPGFALAFILTLGLGIGANTAIFSVINGVLLRPLPYPEADRIMRASPMHSATFMPHKQEQSCSRTSLSTARFCTGDRPERSMEPVVEAVLSQLGRPEDGTDATLTNNLEFFVRLKPPDQWPDSVRDLDDVIAQLPERWRACVREMPEASAPGGIEGAPLPALSAGPVDDARSVMAAMGGEPSTMDDVIELVAESGRRRLLQTDQTIHLGGRSGLDRVGLAAGEHLVEQHA